MKKVNFLQYIYIYPTIIIFDNWTSPPHLALSVSREQVLRGGSRSTLFGSHGVDSRASDHLRASTDVSSSRCMTNCSTRVHRLSQVCRRLYPVLSLFYLQPSHRFFPILEGLPPSPSFVLTRRFWLPFRLISLTIPPYRSCTDGIAHFFLNDKVTH